jgi:hypothetical protein
LAPQRERTIGCSANLHLIGENRARRGHNPGVIGSNTASAGADACAAGPGPTGRAADRSISSATDGDTASAGAHPAASAAGAGPTACATDSSTSSADGGDTIIPLIANAG